MHSAIELRQLLADTAASWGLQLQEQQLEQFAAYSEALQAWNRRINLTAITEPQAIVVRHFLDSLSCMLAFDALPESLIDIGSGAGFPGLALKIAFPDLRLTLVESVAKKAAFLRAIVDQLGLSQVLISTTRAELLGHDAQHREQYSYVTARAVAELRVLVEYCLPFCRIGGRVIAHKSAGVEPELEAARPAIGKLGGRVLPLQAVQLPGLDPRMLVVLAKIRPTPPAYPRAVGLPAQRPL